MPEVIDHTAEIDGRPVFWRSATPPGGDTAEDGGSAGAVPLYLHGAPGSSDDWVASRERQTGFLQRSGGLAVDLPGFGRSGKPGYLRFTIDEYDGFIERFLEEVGQQRVQLVMHDWGAVGLVFAQRLPARVERLVLVNAVPLLPGFRWHRIARVWQTVGLGELAMGSTYRRTLRFATRNANATPGPMPDAWLDSVLAHFDEGTQRAMLRLFRSSPPAVLAAAGARLGELDMPALVVSGMRDPYIPARFGREYASALAHAELVELADAGHWPWLDRPELIDRVVEFLSAG